MAPRVDRHILDERIAQYRGTGPGIITGMVEHADPADLAPFQRLFGSGRDFEPSFNLYFHWYNLIHELGHIARAAAGLGYVGTTPVMEEKYVNDLAVAYWRQYGEPATLQSLGEIVTAALARTTKMCAQSEILDYYEQPQTIQRAYGDPLEYGFIQFSLVRLALDHIRHDFRTELQLQGFTVYETPGTGHSNNSCSQGPMQAIVDQAVVVLRSLGVEIGDVRVFPHYNPNEHRVI